MARQKMTPEQARAYSAEQRDKLNAIMGRAYGDLLGQPMWSAVMRNAAVLADRGPVNVIAITAQLPEATDVRSRAHWRKAGRHQVKGSTALRIWTPVRRRPDDTGEHESQAAAPPAETGTAPGDDVRAFKAGCVYDISQTEGDAVPAVVADVPTPSALLHLFAQKYEDTWGTIPEATARRTDAAGPESGALSLLYLHAHAELRAADMPGQHEAEAASAAHIAALILGIPPGPAPVPPLAGWITDTPEKPPIRDSAVRVITLGRRLASLADRPPLARNDGEDTPDM